MTGVHPCPGSLPSSSCVRSAFTKCGSLALGRTDGGGGAEDQTYRVPPLLPLASWASASSSSLSSAGRGHGCPVLGATAALCLLHPGWLPAASSTAPATTSTSTSTPAAATTPTGVCGPPPGWSTAAQCQPDAGAPAATTLSHCTIHSSPVPYREPRPATNGNRRHLGKPEGGPWALGVCVSVSGCVFMSGVCMSGVCIFMSGGCL